MPGVAKVVREKIFTRLRQEVPYNLMLEPGEFTVRQNGSYLIRQDVLVPTHHVRPWAPCTSG